MLWKPLRKLARLYSLVAIGLILLMFTADGIMGHQLNEYEATLYLFFPYGVLLGLVVSWLFMSAGSLLTLCALIAFYLTQYAQSGSLSHNIWPPLVAGPAFFFLLAGQLKAIGAQKKRKKNTSKK